MGIDARCIGVGALALARACALQYGPATFQGEALRPGSLELCLILTGGASTVSKSRSRADQKKAQWNSIPIIARVRSRVPARQVRLRDWAGLPRTISCVNQHLKPGTEVTVHIQNAERSDVGLHLIW